MMATTPIGTRTLLTSMPLGRVKHSVILPTGSESLTTSRMPSAIATIRSRVRRKRSIITSFIVSFTPSISALLAARIASVSAIRASAIERSARFFSSLESMESARVAAFAPCKISSVVMLCLLLQKIAFQPLFPQKDHTKDWVRHR